MTTTASLRSKIEQLEAEAEEASNRYLRLAADFDNYKKRARQEQSDLVRSANAELIGKLLPVVDNFHRVLESTPESAGDAWVKGLKLSLQQLEELLAAQGVQPIEAVGQPFDPSLHEAIGHEESSEHPEDTVVTEVRRGYRLNDRVVRPALVRVARPVGG
ncbi:MAG TPA: nucleotide exchange factor GrpE [Candidatus Dormibacteraeota bacterium]|nr:nucleotide exchange factor GrpE [Candidatus Dormibacteraeota bacterium]